MNGRPEEAKSPGVRGKLFVVGPAHTGGLPGRTQYGLQLQAHGLEARFMDRLPVSRRTTLACNQ
jgi:hypothetical protein